MKILKGTSRPCLINNFEPKPTAPLGEPPSYFSKDEAGCWAELQKIIAPFVLKVSDRWLCEIACVFMARFRRREAMQGAELGRLASALSLLGMSPSDRAKIIATEPPKGNPFSEFVQ